MTEDGNRLGLKILSIALAIGLWLGVSVEKPGDRSQRVVEASVTYNTPPELILLDPVSKVEVRLQGSEETVRTLNPQMVGVLLDLREASEGDLEVRVGPENVFAPEGTEVVSITPSQLRLAFDRVETWFLPVREDLQGEPAAGARLLSYTSSPDQVAATGPESILKTFTFVTTEPIRLDTHALSFEETVSIRAPNPLISIQPSRVKVRIELELQEPDSPSVPDPLPEVDSRT